MAEVLSVILGLALGLVLAISVFMLTTPLFIGLLVNQPGGNRPSGFHLFTYPEEGKAKIIVRGEVVVRMIMIYAGHTFQRRGTDGKNWTVADREYWEIIENPNRNENPISDIIWFAKPWAYYVYWTTGAVFTGIYPYQRVREYQLEKTEVVRSEERFEMREQENVNKDVSEDFGNLRLSVKDSWSDHYRVRQFIHPLRIAQADTVGNISLNMLLAVRAQVTNPHKAAFGVDRWDVQLVNMVSDAVTKYARMRPFSDVLTPTNPELAEALNDSVTVLTHDTEFYGINIRGVEILDIKPNLDREERRRLYAAGLAKPVGEATVIDGESRAKALRAINKANQDGGEHAIATMNAEALVRAAEAARGGTVLLGQGSSVSDPTLAAILAELKKRNQSEE